VILFYFYKKNSDVASLASIEREREYETGERFLELVQIVF
jgi:hypothetical protein